MSTPQKIWNNAAALRAHCDTLPSGTQIGYIRGCFDLFHEGHRYFLGEAKKHCDFLIVSIAPDGYIRRAKGEGRPIDNRQKRAEAVATMDEVDAVIAAPSAAAPQEMEYTIIAADIAFFGRDYTEDTLPRVYREFAPKRRFIELDKGISTTALINDMKN